MELLAQFDWGEYGLLGLVIGTVLTGVYYFLWRFMGIIKEFLMGKDGNGGYLEAQKRSIESNERCQRSLEESQSSIAKTAENIAKNLDDHEQSTRKRITAIQGSFQDISTRHDSCITAHGGLIEAGKHACDVAETVCRNLDLSEEVAPALARIREALGRGSAIPNPPRVE